MGTAYFPGCKFKRLWPESNNQLIDAVFERGWADRTTGCCKDEELDISPDERVLCVCPSCVSLLRRRIPDNEIVSVWRLIANDDTFPLPDYHGARLALHNCEIFRDTGTSEAVHDVAKRMNLELIDYPNDDVHVVAPEIDESFEDDRDRPHDGRPPHFSFLGHFDRSKLPQRPGGSGGRGEPGGHGSGGSRGRRPGGHKPGEPGGRRPGGRESGGFGGHGAGMLDMMPQADKQAINDYCNSMQGDEVVCFCTGCHAGLQAADKKAIEFIELVFPPNA